MAQATYPVGLVRVQGEQLSLSTTRAVLGIPPNMHQAKIYVPTSDFRLHLNPALVDAVFYDASATAGTRYKTAGLGGSIVQGFTDRAVGGASGTLLDAATTSDILYLCFSDVVGGIRVVMIGGSVNAEAATIDVEYRKNDSTWADVTETDGTASGGATLAQTGSITWTAPTDWVQGNLRDMVTTTATPGTDRDATNMNGFWLRIKWSAALGADVEIDEIWAIHKDTNRGYFYAGVEYSLSLDLRQVGSIESVVASGTATMDITWSRLN